MSEPSSKNVTDTEEFLNAILPDEGLRCIFLINGKRTWNEFYESNAEASRALLDYDRRGIVSYHACSTFGDRTHVVRLADGTEKNKPRSATNVERIGTFWADVDAGPGKPYPDVDAAEEAVLDFCTLVDLPDPLLVRSGRGLHAYWLLDAPLDLVSWRPYAIGLKRLCVEHKLHADPVRTADAASVLRPVGTHHRKDAHAPRYVESDRNFARHRHDAFGHLRRGVDRSVSSGLGSRPAHLADVQSLPVPAVTHDPSDAPTIAKHCRQLSRMQETHGVLAEPVWRACLGVLAFATDGERYAHEWSKGDDRYAFDDTQGRLERSKAVGAPITCAHFQDIDPSGACGQCPHRGAVVTPLQLGRAPYLEARIEIVETPDGEQKRIIPGGFKYDHEDWLCKEKEGEDGSHRIAPHSLALVAISALEKHSGEHRLTFEVTHPHEGVRRITLPASELMGRSPGAAMAGQNVVVYNDQAFVKYMKAAMIALQEAKKTELLFKSYGWKSHRAFLAGSTLYTMNGPKLAPIDGEAKQRSRAFAPRGSLAEWTAAADQFFAPGCETQGFAVMCAFAAPLMRLLAEDEGGAIVSLVSRGTAKGKTAALTGCHSVWGDRWGLEINMTATENARGITYGALCNLPIIFDEATQRDPDELDRFLRIFTGGRDRMRAQSDGTLRPVEDTWQTIMVCGANQPMVDMVRAKGGSDAMAYRVFELQAALPKGVGDGGGEKLKKQLQHNSGNAGPAFMRLLVEKPGFFEIVQGRVNRISEEMYAKAQLSRDHRFWIRLLACVQVASEMVTRQGLLHFSPQRLTGWAYERALEAAGSSPSVVSPDSVLSEFMNENANRILSVTGAYRAGLKTPPLFRPSSAILGRYEVDTGRLFLSVTDWRRWLIRRDYTVRELHDGLETLGVKREGTRKITLVAGTDISGGQTDCIEINAHHEAWRWEPPVERSGKVVSLRGMR